MKIFVTLVTLCVALSAHAARLRGTIINRLSDSVEISWWDAHGYAMESRQAMLDASGRFSIELPTKYPYNAFMLETGGKATDLIVARDADLSVTINGKLFHESIHYTGRGSEVANLAARRVGERDVLREFSGRMHGLTTMAPTEAVAEGRKALDEEVAFLEKHGAALPTPFKNWWLAHFSYSFYNALLQYPFFYEARRLKTYNVDSIPAENYAVLDAVPLAFHDEFININSYQNYATGVHRAMVERDSGRVANAGTAGLLRDSMLRVSVPRAMPPATAEHYLAEGVRADLYKHNPLPKGLASLADFKKRYPQSRYLPSLESRAADRKRLAPGQPAPDFAFITTDGKAMRLTDLKGSVVLLDFWASWCGPCIAEIPHTKKLEEKFSGKPVVFLAVSIDEDEAAWKATMEKHNLGGVTAGPGGTLHTRVTGGWSAAPAKLFGVSGVPAYFLVDKDGKLTAGGEPRPSYGEETVKQIGMLLE